MKRIFITVVIFVFSCCLTVSAQSVKRAEFAGTWYPGNARQLQSDLDKFIGKAQSPSIKERIIGIISPHAGYMYSGGVAGYSYKAVEGKDFDTVIVLAPTHKYYFEGVSIYPEGVFETPLGNLEVDKELAGKFNSLSFVQFEPRYFNKEHSVEAQLPFIIKSLGKVKILPVLFGKISFDDIKALAKKIEEVSSQKRVLVVVSSDLSHFHPYEEAVKIDTDTLRLIGRQDAKKLWDTRQYFDGRACGINPIVTLLLYAQMRSAKAVILKYDNSGNTGGDKNSVVGYASVVVYMQGGIIRTGAVEEENN